MINDVRIYNRAVEAIAKGDYLNSSAGLSVVKGSSLAWQRHVHNRRSLRCQVF